MRVRHAELVDVTGRVARTGGWAIVPAGVDFGDERTSAEFRLADAVAGRPAGSWWAAVRFGYDAAWVRARLPSAFGVTPPPAEGEKALLDVGFVAVPDGGEEGLAFICSDHYGRTALYFSDAVSDAAAKRDVAAAFWGWLLAEPGALADFEASVYHIGGGVWLDFGCHRGEPYCDERADDGT